ncbi:MAG: SemiSWEET transporter [Bacteroidota bacterium]|jgi:MtN3 and saliva related transmembrane protein|nr:SemiSWEET transporter [Bacteroidota bacterium]
MTIIEILGLVAGACTTIAFIPQVVKTYKSKSAKDLSSGMFLTFWIGIILWLIYGIIINDLPIIVANVLTFLLASTILMLKIRYRNQ